MDTVTATLFSGFVSVQWMRNGLFQWFWCCLFITKQEKGKLKLDARRNLHDFLEGEACRVIQKNIQARKPHQCISLFLAIIKLSISTSQYIFNRPCGFIFWVVCYFNFTVTWMEGVCHTICLCKISTISNVHSLR